MLFDEQMISNNFDDETQQLDEQISSFISNHHTKNQRNQTVQGESKPKQFQKSQQNRTFVNKIQPPRQFQKAKRTLNKIVHQYCLQLKREYQRVMDVLEKSGLHDKIKKNYVTFYLRKDKIGNIVESMSKFVGINYKYKNVTDLKFNYLQEIGKKSVFQSRKGSFCYMPECQKIINLNLKAQISQIKITSQIKNFKIPDFATPVPFKDSIYFLDPAIMDKKQKIFLPDKNVYKINDKGQISIIQKSPQRQKIKCAITRDENFIYLLGGMVGQNKIIVNCCEKFCPKNLQFIQMPNLRGRHRCPSTCILKNTIWLFSPNGIENFDKSLNEWRSIQMPWQIRTLPFQFVTPYSDTQIIIFGGIENGMKGTDVKIYNCEYNWVDTFHQILPLPVGNQKIWGPSFTDVGMSVLSSIQGQNQPDLKQKNNIVQAIYFTVNGIFLHSITTAK